MFLRSITIRGFKSFADKTVLEFIPGVSVIVGPNGSGKSNLVDAISWVLGEQGARVAPRRAHGRRDLRRDALPTRPRHGRGEARDRQLRGQDPRADERDRGRRARSSGRGSPSTASTARSCACSTCRSCSPRPASAARCTPWSDRASSRRCSWPSRRTVASTSRRPRASRSTAAARNAPSASSRTSTRTCCACRTCSPSCVGS